MLSEEEKIEMLQDSRSQTFRDDFRSARGKNISAVSFEDYINFLNDIQKIFSPFKVSRQVTVTRFNKL